MDNSQVPFSINLGKHSWKHDKQFIFSDQTSSVPYTRFRWLVKMPSLRFILITFSVLNRSSGDKTWSPSRLVKMLSARPPVGNVMGFCKPLDDYSPFCDRNLRDFFVVITLASQKAYSLCTLFFSKFK